MLPYAISFLVAASLLGLDQWSKFWTDSNMALGETMPFLGSLLELHCVHNYGVAWSLFSNMRWILVGVTGCIIIAVAAVIMLRLVRHPVGIFAAFLILGGGIGNLLDRIFLGYVVDMLRFPFWPSYPTFNIADVCVVSGCVLWLIYALFLPEREAGRGRRARSAGSAVRNTNAVGAAASGNADAGKTGTAADHIDRNTDAGSAAFSSGDSSTDTEPPRANPIREPVPRGTNDDWQEKWRKRQLERQGRR